MPSRMEAMRASLACRSRPGRCRCRRSASWGARFARGQTKSRPIRARAAPVCALPSVPAKEPRRGEAQPVVALRARVLCAVASHIEAPGAKALCRARTRADTRPHLRRRIRPAAARAEHLGDAGSNREGGARAIDDAAAGTGPHPGHGRKLAMIVTSASRAVATPKLPRLRAPILFGMLLALFALLAARSLYLQWIDNAFLQEQGSSRYSRDLEVLAHRGRILDRFGAPLAISTPVKAIWAWPEKVEATPEQLQALATALDLAPSALAAKLDAGEDFVYLKRGAPPEIAARVATLGIKGVHDDDEYRRYYPGGEVMSHVLGFTGD